MRRGVTQFTLSVLSCQFQQIYPVAMSSSSSSMTSSPANSDNSNHHNINNSDSDEGLDHSFTSMCSTNSSRSSTKKNVIFNDVVHSHLELPHLCSKIINTPQFQRLRNLKQLGLCYHLYPSASHNRFEHCIGTSHLAGKYCKILQRNQPELGIDDTDILCLYIAGLCHDLGHGPFSHTWEHFMSHYEKNYSHEMMSLKMFDFMIQDNKLRAEFEHDNLQEIDVIFIKELLIGKALPGNEKLVGRGADKYFLYQIVSNDETKVDVDKFDYLQRDCKQLNLKTGFDFDRLLDNTRVLPIENEKDGIRMKIAFRKKISGTLEDLFVGRFRLHQIAYQHRVTKIIEEMVLDGLKVAEPYFQVTSDDGTIYKLSSAYQSAEAFMKLTDGIFDMILYWGNSGLAAKKIFSSILKRDLYKTLGYLPQLPDDKVREDFDNISPNLMFIPTMINYGAKEMNPLNNAHFYEKSSPNSAFTLEFPPPKVETKCFIAYRPFSTTEDSEVTIAPLVELRDVKQKLEEWSKLHNIKIEKID